MVSAAMVGEIADRHEIDELRRIPDMHILGIATDEIPTDEDVHNAAYEGYLLSYADGLIIVPVPA